jgi:hypothetical protein
MNGFDRKEMTEASYRRRKTRPAWAKDLLAAAMIPEMLPSASYFLEPINTPAWHWVFRAAFAVCLLSLFAAYGFCRSKDGYDTRSINLAGEKERMK